MPHAGADDDDGTVALEDAAFPLDVRSHLDVQLLALLDAHFGGEGGGWLPRGLLAIILSLERKMG